MFRYQTIIDLRDTDATGVIYFPNQFDLALQTLQVFLRPTPFAFKAIVDSLYLMPVVHAEADYLSGLHLDDEVEISMYLDKIGHSSFTLCFDYYNKTKQTLAGTAKVTHVMILKETKKSTPIPQEFRDVLSELSVEVVQE